MPKQKKDTGRVAVKSVTDRGCSRRYPTAENHLNAQEHYRNRAQGRINKAPKGPFLNDKIPKG